VFVSAIPDWHWAWQFTHGREAINPMPLLSERIVRLRGNGSTPNYGVGAYSEGVADDLNRAIWSGIAADPRQSAAGLVEQYAQYHFHAAAAPAMQSALLGLEQNWIGDISTNRHIESTLLSLQAAERLTPPDELLTNWRLQMYLYRGYYDAFVPGKIPARAAVRADSAEHIGSGLHRRPSIRNQIRACPDLLREPRARLPCQSHGHSPEVRPSAGAARVARACGATASDDQRERWD
jgi:hypothetical protein